MELFHQILKTDVSWIKTAGFSNEKQYPEAQMSARAMFPFGWKQRHD
jgi:hypothetical protein